MPNAIAHPNGRNLAALRPRDLPLGRRCSPVRLRNRKGSALLIDLLSSFERSLLLPLALGFAMFVVLQRLSIVYPLVISLPPRLIFLVPIGAILFAFCFLSVLPTIISVLRSKPIDLLREAEQ